MMLQTHANVNERLYEAMKALQLADLESDTDSISTPSNSPSRTSKCKRFKRTSDSNEDNFQIEIHPFCRSRQESRF